MEIINKVNKTFQFNTRTWRCAKTVNYVPTMVNGEEINVLFHKINKQISIIYFLFLLFKDIYIWSRPRPSSGRTARRRRVQKNLHAHASTCRIKTLAIDFRKRENPSTNFVPMAFPLNSLANKVALTPVQRALYKFNKSWACSTRAQ
jgi:hypothetical protein